MAATTEAHKIFMLVVLRTSDKTVVASYQETQDVTVEGVRECIAGNGSMQSGKRYTSEGETQSIHYKMDGQGRAYCVVTTPKFPLRLAFRAVDDLQERFRLDFGSKVAKATEQSLSSAATPIMKQLMQKHLAAALAADNLEEVKAKIEVVKTSMQANIQQLLVNDEKLARIEGATVQLGEQSLAFRNSSKAVADKMWWQAWKTRLAIIAVVVCVLLIIIVPFMATSK